VKPDLGSAAGIAVVKAVGKRHECQSDRRAGTQRMAAGRAGIVQGPQAASTASGSVITRRSPVTEALVKWMAQHYKITPNWLIIPGSDVRAEALMRGQLDATPAEIVDVLNILNAKPGQFHVLDLLRENLSRS
jgi:hypothetical protein